MLFLDQTFSMFIAPPAWGKTYLFRQWSSSNPDQFLFISPLRALAIEVQKSCPDVEVVLPEEILNLDWEELKKQKPDLVVVWDEVHLVFEWGLSFRNAILEAWYGFCVSGLAGIGLTATLTPQADAFFQETLAESHTHLLYGDAGNMNFKFHPEFWFLGPRQWLEELLLQPLSGRTLVFCHHRHEVDFWCKKLIEENIEVWGCKGGETKEFQERLNVESPPDVIVATSCLSHGVNLPQLRRVIILDQTPPQWMVHQMRTRAGRRGEIFEVWGTLFSQKINFKHLPLAFFRLWVKLMIHRFQNSMKAWIYGI
jgi:ATP-dependent DNA helicase RecQ